jgi:DNA replicative helicase MCM subunit Mcm2 (Cdc46/Mcm family)
MELEFFCRSCNHTFNNEGRKKEYNHPLYGPCSKMVAECPKCGEESSEKVKPKKSKTESFSAPAPSCSSGGCSTGSCPFA